MKLCSYDHPNPDDLRYCEECEFPLDIPDKEKITFLENKMRGEINYEIYDGILTKLEIEQAKKYSIDIDLLFPQLTNLTVDAGRISDATFLQNLKKLRYLTLDFKGGSVVVKITSDDLDLLPSTISDLKIRVNPVDIETTDIALPKDLLSYFPNLENLFIYCNLSNLDFLSEGHNTLDLLEFMGERFDFKGEIANFPSLSEIIVEFSVNEIDIKLKNLPNFNRLTVILSSLHQPIQIESSNADYELMIKFDSNLI